MHELKLLWNISLSAGTMRLPQRVVSLRDSLNLGFVFKHMHAISSCYFLDFTNDFSVCTCHVSVRTASVKCS
jgi:hypothetical protein